MIAVFDERFPVVEGRITDRIYEIGPTKQKVKLFASATMGHLGAAVRTGQIISQHSPALIIYFGTAASLRPDEVQLGDVVIPRKAVSRVYEKISERGQKDYDERVSVGGFKEFFFESTALISDIWTKDTSEDALPALATLDIKKVVLAKGADGEVKLGDKTFALRAPRVMDDVDVFSCGMVIDSVAYREFIRTLLNEHLRKAAIVDMESYGFFGAIDASKKGGAVGSSTEGLMIKGISDYAGRKSQTEALPTEWKELSLKNAATVAALLLERLTGAAPAP